MTPGKPNQNPAQFCWQDLAATDARTAAAFYAELFGWQARRQVTNGGEWFCLTHEGANIASLFQLDARQLAGGVPSHWTPYVGVADIEQAAARVPELGGQVLVAPFTVDGLARVSLINDSAGALLGLWEIRP